MSLSLCLSATEPRYMSSNLFFAMAMQTIKVAISEDEEQPNQLLLTLLSNCRQISAFAVTAVSCAVATHIIAKIAGASVFTANNATAAPQNPHRSMLRPLLVLLPVLSPSFYLSPATFLSIIHLCAYPVSLYLHRTPTSNPTMEKVPSIPPLPTRGTNGDL